MIEAIQYFDRACWALRNATSDALPLNVKSHLAAFAVHACQSLKESLEQLALDHPNDVGLAQEVKELPHSEIIGNVRNLDLHGWPLPICDPKRTMVAMVTKPDQPIELSSSHGVGVTLQLDGLTPRVSRTPKVMKHGKVSIGGSTVSIGCHQGTLVVHDFSTTKDYVLLIVLRTFLEKCHSIIKSRWPEDNSASDTSGPSTSGEGCSP